MRKQSKLKMVLGGILAGALALAGCASDAAEGGESGSLEDMEPIVLTYSESNVETAAHVRAMQGFMDQVTEQTDGKITFDTYYSAALHPVEESLSAIKSGLTDITFLSPSNVPEQLPAALWEATVAQDAIDLEFPMSLIQGTPVQTAMYEEGALADELANFDAQTLVTWGTAPNSALCKAEVTTAEEASGRMVRTPGPPFVDEVEELGMTSVTLPVTDVYEGLQRGVIDCFMNVISPFMTLGIWEEASYFVPAEFAAAFGSQLVMKKSVFESLPTEAQQIIFDARVDLLTEILETTLATNVQWAEEAPGKGVTFADPASFNEAIESAREDYIEQALANPPASVSDPDAFMDQLAGHVDNWDSSASELEVESGSPTTEAGWIELYKSTGEIDWDAYAEILHEYLEPYRP